MKWCLIAGILFLAGLPAKAAPVQTCGGGANFGASASCAFGVALTANHLVVLTMFINDATTTITVLSDSCGDTWTATPASPNRGTGNTTWIYYTVTLGGCATMTMTFSATVGSVVSGAEYSGMAISSVFDCDAAASGNSTALASGNCTTRLGAQSASATSSLSGQWTFLIAAFKFNNTSQDELIGAGGVAVNLATFTAGASYTIEKQGAGSNTDSGLLEDQTIGNAPPTITPSNPIVSQGATLQFSVVGAPAGTWSCSGCAGSINASTGLYTAPASVTPQQSIGGWQLHPNNHVFNTRVDSLPLRSDSATLMAGTGANKILYREISFPTNYTNASTPTVPMSFFYTSANNANFEIPAYPNAKLESGWFNAIINNTNSDHHLITVNTSTGVLANLYQYYPVCTTTAASVNGNNVATLTCSANPITGGFLVGSNNICVGGFTGADTYFNVCPTSVTAVTSSSISYTLVHGAASASTNGSVSKNVQGGSCSTTGTCNSQSGIKFNYSDYVLPANGTPDAAGLELTGLMLRLQEMEQAIATAGSINHALRMTLRNNFICSSNAANACYTGKPAGIRYIWPATSQAFSGAGINPYGLRYRLKAAYNCGALSSIAQILCTQLKNYGLILADGGTDWSIISEAAPWPVNIIAAMNEMEAANIVGSTNMEVVDESSLQVSPTSGETTTNQESVTFTRTSDSIASTVAVALIGVAVGLTNDVMYIQAGTGARQLTASVHGGTTNTVTWGVSPAITGGSLTSGGLLTPPATIAAVTSYTITATSTENAAVAASMTVYIFPTGSIYIRPDASAAFTDSLGHVWAPFVQGNSGSQLGCCGDLHLGPWGSLVDKEVYYFRGLVYGDGYFNFTVPNGTYNVTIKLGTDQAFPDSTIDTLETQATVFYSNVDVNQQAGGNFKPLDRVMNTAVTNTQLQVVIRVPTLFTSTNPIINAIQIDYLGPVSATTITPGVKVTSGVTIK